MDNVLAPDLCILGAGSGGLSVAAAAASLGVSVVLIEKAAMGGDCLNVGCIPSKALIAAGRAAAAARKQGRFGLVPMEPAVDYERVRAHVLNVIADLKPTDSESRFAAMNVRVLRAAGRFVDKNTVEAAGQLIRARRFIVATGSSPAIPPVSGLNTIRYLTNESIFESPVLPEHLIVIGAGATGLELAQAFRRLGSKVTVLEAGVALAHQDREIADVVCIRLVREGVVIRENCEVVRAEPHDAGVRMTLKGIEAKIDGSHVLVASGRKANVGGLGLEAGAIAFTPLGITVSGQLRSVTNRRVYAVGDVAGRGQSTNMANYQAGLVLRETLFRLNARLRPQIVPQCIFTDPEIATAGLNETEARHKHKLISILRWPFSENDRARTELETDGLIKLVTTRRGKILGAALAGPNAGELIALWALAINKGMKIGDIRDIVMPYPVLSEVSKRAALSWYLPKLSSPLLRRLLKFLRSWG